MQLALAVKKFAGHTHKTLTGIQLSTESNLMNIKSLKKATLLFLAWGILIGFYSLSGGQNLQSFQTPLTAIKFSAPAGSSTANATVLSSASSETNEVLSFIESRSGIKLDEDSKSILRQNQTRTLLERTGIDADQFADELAKTLVERIRTAPEKEYNEYIAGLLRSKKSIAVPMDMSSPKTKVFLASGIEIARVARSIRSGKYDPNFASYFAAGQMRLVVAASLGVISRSSTTFMTSTRDGKSLPPAQRLLLAYLILSGDTGFLEQKENLPLVGKQGRYVDIPFEFFLTSETIRKITR
jgi:hypothetical protein